MKVFLRRGRAVLSERDDVPVHQGKELGSRYMALNADKGSAAFVCIGAVIE